MKKLFHLLCYVALSTISTCLLSCGGKAQETTSAINVDKLISLDAINDNNDLPFEDSVTFTGKVKAYDRDTKYGCFFVDPEIVDAGVVEGLGEKANGGICTDSKYGKGVPINVSKLNPDGDYPNPPKEDALVIVKGYWEVGSYQGEDNTAILYITEYEPFF